MHPYLVRHVVYPVLQWKSGGRVQQYLRQLEKSQWQDSAELREFQWSRLSRLLDHAYRRVPYYRALFDDCGMHPAEFKGLEDFARLPALTKDVLRDRPHDLMAADISGPLVERRTSGSTGIPVVVHVHPRVRDAWTAALMRMRRWWGLDIGTRQLKLVNPHGKSRGTLTKQAFWMNQVEYSVFDLDEAALEKVYRFLHRAGCEELMGYPSALTCLAHHVASRGGRKPPRLRAILATGELLSSDQRAVLHTVFDCPVIDSYGASECDHLAGECPQGSLHLAAENVLVEFEPHTESNGDGPATELLVTDLNNYAMPLLRYRIGDRGSPGPACACGRSLPVLALQLGRTQDVVILPGGRKMDAAVFSAAVEEMVRGGLTVRQFRTTQHAVDYIEIQIATPDRGHQALQRLPARVQEMLGAPVAVIVRPMDRIPTERTGKLRQFVSRVKDPGVA